MRTRPTGQSRMSSTARRPWRRAAASSTVRKALAVRPPRPMTRPRSSGATVSSKTVERSRSMASTGWGESPHRRRRLHLHPADPARRPRARLGGHRRRRRLALRPGGRAARAGRSRAPGDRARSRRQGAARAPVVPGAAAKARGRLACTPQEGVRQIATRAGVPLYATDEALAHATGSAVESPGETLHERSEPLARIRRRCGPARGMHERRQQLEAVDEPRARAAEVGRAVDQRRPRRSRTAGSSAKPGCARRSGTSRARARDVEAAARDHEHLGRRVAHRVPRHLPRRPRPPGRAGSTPPASATSSGPQCPLAERRVDPLEQHAASPWRTGDPRAHRVDARLELLRRPRPRALGYAERRRRRGGCRRRRRRGVCGSRFTTARRARQRGGEGRDASRSRRRTRRTAAG